MMRPCTRKYEGVDGERMFLRPLLVSVGFLTQSISGKVSFITPYLVLCRFLGLFGTVSHSFFATNLCKVSLDGFLTFQNEAAVFS